MKRKTFLILLASMLLGLETKSQWVVTDAKMIAQTIINTALAKDQLELTQVFVDRIGDASTLKQVPGLSEVLNSLGGTTAINPADPLEGCKATTAMTDSGGDLYHVIGEFIPRPDGTNVARRAECYKKYAAAQGTASHYLDVVRETEKRRTDLIDGIRRTTEAIQSAKDLAEVQKLQAVASAQGAALNAIDGQRSAALGVALVQSANNATDQAKQTQAREEERAVDFDVALSKADQFLTPVASRVTIPGTRTFRR